MSENNVPPVPGTEEPDPVDPNQPRVVAIPEEAPAAPVPEKPKPVRTPKGQQATLHECLHGLRKETRKKK